VLVSAALHCGSVVVSRQTNIPFRDIAWPACSPDLAVPDYLLWGYVKSDVLKTYPANIDDVSMS